MRSLFRPFVAYSALTIALVSCKAGEGGTDGGDQIFDGSDNRPKCIPDRANTPEDALALTLGEAYVGAMGSEPEICPPTDRDFYKFDVPANTALVTVEVGYPSMASTPVELAFELFRAPDMNMPVATAQDEIAGDNKSTLKKTFFLGLDAASYVLRVRDVGDNEQDVLNHYQVKISTAVDADMNEPNNTCATASALALAANMATKMGAITYQGDKDAYTLTVPAGVKIVDAVVTIPMTTPVDAKVSLFDTSGKFLTAVANPRGEAGGTNVHLRYGLESSGGTYCLVVEDDDGADADATVTYNLAVKLDDETDPQETAHRNDTPDTATDLGAGGTRTGRIGSTADFDWFKVTSAVGNIIEIKVDCPGCRIQPAISLVYGDPRSPCDGSSACDYLLEPGQNCMIDDDCESKVCRPVPGGTKRCAVHCGGDEANLDCEGFSCNQVGPVGACTAAATCVQSRCGVLQYAETAAMDTVSTAEPIKATPSYILVHDFQDDQFAVADYTLTVTTGPDPEGRPDNDNFYFSDGRATLEQKLNRSQMKARSVPWTAGPGGKTASGSGCISYKGDFDVFRLTGGNPCTATTAMGGGNCGLQIDYDHPMGPVDPLYFLYSDGFGGRASFQVSALGNQTTFGDAPDCSGQRECMVYNANDNGDYYLVVRDQHGSMFEASQWDTSSGHCYHFTVRAAAAAGCPRSCPMVTNGLCTCP
ncbi:MAG: hypothetical protein U1E65_29720 [Myxococcota bacterium]